MRGLIGACSSNPPSLWAKWKQWQRKLVNHFRETPNELKSTWINFHFAWFHSLCLLWRSHIDVITLPPPSPTCPVVFAFLRKCLSIFCVARKLRKHLRSLSEGRVLETCSILISISYDLPNLNRFQSVIFNELMRYFGGESNKEMLSKQYPEQSIMAIVCVVVDTSESWVSPPTPNCMLRYGG